MDNGSRGVPPPSGPPLTSPDLPAWRTRFPGYALYFLYDVPRLLDVHRKIRAMSTYTRLNLCEKYDQIEQLRYFELNCSRLLDEFKSDWPEFGTDVENNALEVSNLWGAVMHKMLYERRNEGQAIDSELEDVRRVHAGLMKCEPLTPLLHVNSTLLGKFVTIRGTVVRIGALKPQCIQLVFLCLKCDEEFSVEQPGGTFLVPEKCRAHDDCKSKSFRPVESSPGTTLIDSRSIRLQDTARSELEVGDVPRMIDCEISGSMVDNCNNGDAVTISGVVKAKRDQQLVGTDKGLHSFYVEVLGIKNHKESKRTIGGHWFSLSNIDYCAIGEIHDSQQLFRLLVGSLCPSIYGHELVKAALVLSLFGGGQPDKDSLVPRRDDINVLLIGDPGMGKSQMLKSVANVAPRSVYVCGTGSTVAGLTVTLVKEGEGFAVEAGALVMADCGTCCIDEFEKMPALHDALLEAMEQQTVSVAKSGVNRRFPARTTVVAASNPEHGHYDKYKSFSENVKVSAPLLSRFDVVFLMLDTHDQNLDLQIVEHILGTSGPVTSCEEELEEERQPLRISLCPKPGEHMDNIPHHLIRKYVAYARHYVHPRLSEDAKSALKTYYLRLRARRRQIVDTAPVTARQLESLIRLTEARAKVELRELATLQDAEEVLEIFESGLESVFDDSLYNLCCEFDEQPTPSAGPSGVQKQARTLYAALQKIADTQNKDIFTLHEMEMAMRKARYTATVETLVSLLNEQGKLLKKPGHTYQLSG